MKARDEVNELRQMTKEALKEKIEASENELMNLRFRNSTAQLTKPSQLGKLRKTIARAKTVLSEQNAAANSGN